MAELQLSVIVPTYNEASNVSVLIERISKALESIPHEILVADDDSPDRTWEIVDRISAARKTVHCLRRTKDKGLYPAVFDAFAQASGRCLAVMDADLQHDESILPRLLDALLLRGRVLAVGSRHVPGGGVQDWNWARRLLSFAGNSLVAFLLGRGVRDPLSGFFMIDREVYRKIAPKLRPRGFKILMDILSRLPRDAAIEEVGYVFKPRRLGASKLDSKVAAAFLAALWELALLRFRH
jgi:dolichol-phosphate mannosyltransferase